jgi:pimeloyl-ACP methyl ester carboxylesterase
MHKLALFLCLFPSFLFGQITGDWHASFTLVGKSNRMDLHIEQEPVSLVNLSNPNAKKPEPIAMSSVMLTDSTVAFTYTKIGLSFKGKYYSSGDTLVGIMSQSDVHWTVVFRREVLEEVKLIRPQEPVPPFDYPIEEILIKNGDIVLGATLTLPKDQSHPFPIVVLASGSGAQDRNCELMGHKSFWVIADFLAQNGVGCLRFDDRGVGKSTGVFAQASLMDFGSDVSACVNFLAMDARFSDCPIGIAGHSEGGMHALIAARKNKYVDFVIELASVGTSGRDVLVEQQFLIPLAAGKDSAYAMWNRDVYAGLCNIIQRYPQQKASDPIAAFLDSMYEKAPAEYQANTNVMSFKVGLSVFLNSAWGREFINYDAKKYVKKLKIPVLAINGARDIQVPPTSNQKGFETHFAKQTKDLSEAMIVEGLNHLFQHCTRCDIMEYGDLEETFAPEVLQQMREWIYGLYFRF